MAIGATFLGKISQNLNDVCGCVTAITQEFGDLFTCYMAINP